MQRRSASFFAFCPTYTQITNLATPRSASASFCKQRPDSPEGLADLVQADGCEETPAVPTHAGENRWQWWPQAKPAMGCSTQDPDQSPAHHICHGGSSRAAPYNLVSLPTFRASLHKCPCKRCNGHHSQGDSHELDESRLRPTSHLTQYKCPSDPPQSNQNPEQKGSKGPKQTVYPHAARVEQATFVFLVGVGEISGGFNSSQQRFDLLTWTRAKSDL